MESNKIILFGFIVYYFLMWYSCTDYLKINENLAQCSYDQPRLIYSTKTDALKINFKSLAQGASVGALRGFKLYFEGLY